MISQDSHEGSSNVVAVLVVGGHCVYVHLPRGPDQIDLSQPNFLPQKEVGSLDEAILVLRFQYDTGLEVLEANS